MPWFAFGLLVACVVAALWPRRYHRNHPKAGRSYCYPVFGLLAGSLAMFVLLTHWFDVFVWAAVIFWMLWLGGLIAAIASKKNDGFWPAFGMSALAWTLLLLPIGSTVFHSTSTPSASASQNVGGQEALDQAPAGTGTAPKTCDAKFKQEWQQNADFRVIDGGLYADVTHKRITPASADKKQREIAGHDVRALAGYAYSEGLRDNATYTDLLTHDKKCLSTQGVALYEKLIKKWDSSKVSIVQASASATNTGMENSKLVVNSKSGITGDRTALRRTYPDKSTRDTLARCGNPVFPDKPKHIPPGKTDEHPPKETPPPTSITTPPTTTPPTTAPPTTTPPTTTPPTTTPPTTTPPTTTPPTTTPPTTTPPTTTPPETCPPGQTGTPPDCLQTKDPDDNHHDDGDDGKPPVTTEGPVDTATPVETQPADPTDQPGDEATDEPADGATQQPTTEPTQPPATEAPTDDEPGGTPIDPDGNALAGMAAAPLLGIGALWRRRRLGL